VTGVPETKAGAPAEAGHGERGTRVFRSREGLAEALAGFRAEGAKIALVPTMGALHAGHLALLDRAAELGDRVVLSIFVNPLQFGEGEDLDRYPRTLERDLEQAAARGAALAFVPDVEVMYPHGLPRVTVDPGPAGDRLCGAFRPGHFRGVLTVVARLFGLVRPEVAVFGRKDAQQAALIRQMVRDLELGVEIEVAPLVREEDGLALSSRNAYLTPFERRTAPLLFRALVETDRAFRDGERDAARLEAFARGGLDRAREFRTDYVELVDPGTLDPLPRAEAGALLAAAAWLGKTRLIDNVVLGAADGDPRVNREAESDAGSPS
jgi:pantoate--beta-alanine ligase